MTSLNVPSTPVGWSSNDDAPTNIVINPQGGERRQKQIQSWKTIPPPYKVGSDVQYKNPTQHVGILAGATWKPIKTLQPTIVGLEPRGATTKGEY